MKIKMLLGAPKYADCLEPSSWTINAFEWPLDKFIEDGSLHHPQNETSFSQTQAVLWRSLNLLDRSLRSTLTQNAHAPLPALDKDDTFHSLLIGDAAFSQDDTNAASFLSIASTHADSMVSLDNDDDYLTRSVAFHEPDVPPSSPVGPEKNAGNIRGPLPRNFISLNAIPSAQTLDRLRPSTVTISFVAGIISVKPLRQVTVRQTGRIMNIVELVVGDDTKAGFQITFWLETTDDGKKLQSGLRSELEQCQSRTVALFSDIALTTFMGDVCGSSVRRRGWRTTIKTFGQFSLNRQPSLVQERSEKVDEWCRHHIVGSHSKRARDALDAVTQGDGREEKRIRRESLPLDDTPM